MSLDRDDAAAQALLHAIIGDGADAVFVKDRELRYTMCNGASERLVGLPFANIVGKTDHDLMSAEAAEILAAQDRRVIETGATRTVEERLVLDGQSRVFVTTKFPHRAVDGDIQGLVGVARDITGHVQASERLRADETFLRLVLDAMPVGVMVVDALGDIVLGNDASRRIWGESIVRGDERWRRSRAWFRPTGALVQPHEWASVRALFEGVPQPSDSSPVDHHHELRPHPRRRRRDRRAATCRPRGDPEGCRVSSGADAAAPRLRTTRDGAPEEREPREGGRRRREDARASDRRAHPHPRRLR